MDTLVDHGCIRQIVVSQLFGIFDYRIPEGPDHRFDRLIILYGDNGAGKTTILNLVFSLLYPHPAGGHKTRLAKTPFHELRVDFDDGTFVTATKTDGLIGSYVVGISTADCKNAYSVTFADGKITSENADLFSALGKLSITIYTLPDDRRVKSTQARDHAHEETPEGEEYVWVRTVDGRMVRKKRQQESHHLAIKPVMQQLTAWLRRRVYERSSAGEGNIASIYLQVAKQLSGMTSPGEALGKSTQPELIERIQGLMRRTSDFSRYGLSPQFPGEKFVEVLKSAPVYTGEAVARALEPYLTSLDARLDALESTRSLVDKYIETANSFLHNKTISFSIQDGVQFRSDSEQLDSEWLSSGERQLVLLLSHTILTRDFGGIFLIDEPELSLNIKWQRRLVEALLYCSEGSKIQYIMASHSLELISGYVNNAVRLPSLH